MNQMAPFYSDDYGPLLLRCYWNHFKPAVTLDGEEIIIAVNGHPKVKLIPVEKNTISRKPGSAKGFGHITDSFFDPLPEDFIREFYK